MSHLAEVAHLCPVECVNKKPILGKVLFITENELIGAELIGDKGANASTLVTGIYGNHEFGKTGSGKTEMKGENFSHLHVLYRRGSKNGRSMKSSLKKSENSVDLIR